jgi:hypothetical protein
MKTFSVRWPRLAACSLALGALAVILSSVSNAQGPKAMTTIQLQPGVLIDLARNRAYVMNRENGIDAVGIDRGEVSWKSNEAAKPLGVTGDHLVSQAEPDAATSNVLRIVGLNVQDGGLKFKASKPLDAPGVIPLVTPTLRGDFQASIQPSGDHAQVHWQYRPAPRRGFPEGTVERVQPERGKPKAASLSSTSSQRGSFLLNLSTGQTTDLGAELAPASLEPKFATLAPSDRIPGVTGRQLPSADGRYVMVSKTTGDDRVWDKYTLTVYEQPGGKQLGEFKSHVVPAPFAVVGSRVLFTTSAFTRRGDAGLIREPDKLRAIDLKSGKEAWSHPIRDLSPRGLRPS